MNNETIKLIKQHPAVIKAVERAEKQNQAVHIREPFTGGEPLLFRTELDERLIGCKEIFNAADGWLI